MTAKNHRPIAMISIHCDNEGCPEKVTTGQLFYALVRNYAKTLGWARRSKADFCPGHALSGWPHWKERKAPKAKKVRVKPEQYRYFVTSEEKDGKDRIIGYCTEFPMRAFRGAKTEENALKGIKKEIRRVLKEMKERGEAAPAPSSQDQTVSLQPAATP